MGGDARMMRMGDRRRRDPGLRRQIGECGDCHLEGGIGESAPGVDAERRQADLFQFRYGVSVDLAGLGLRRIGGNAGRSVTLLAVRLGAAEGIGDQCRV